LAEVDRLVAIALGFETAIARPTVGVHGERLGGVDSDKPLEARGRGVGDSLQPQPAEAALPAPLAWIWAGLGLDRAHDDGLAMGAAPGLAGPGPAHQCLVDLHPVLQRLAVRPDPSH